MSEKPSMDEMIEMARKEMLNPGSTVSECDDCRLDCKKSVVVHWCGKKLEAGA